MTTNPYDPSQRDWTHEEPLAARRVVTVRTTVVACVLSALVGSGSTYVLVSHQSSPAAAAIAASTLHDQPAQPPARFNERKLS